MGAPNYAQHQILGYPTGAVELKTTSAVVLNQRTETKVADWVVFGGWSYTNGFVEYTVKQREIGN